MSTWINEKRLGHWHWSSCLSDNGHGEVYSYQDPIRKRIGSKCLNPQSTASFSLTPQEVARDSCSNAEKEKLFQVMMDVVLQKLDVDVKVYVVLKHMLLMPSTCLAEKQCKDWPSVGWSGWGAHTSFHVSAREYEAWNPEGKVVDWQYWLSGKWNSCSMFVCLL